MFAMLTGTTALAAQRWELSWTPEENVYGIECECVLQDAVNCMSLAGVSVLIAWRGVCLASDAGYITSTNIEFGRPGGVAGVSFLLQRNGGFGPLRPPFIPGNNAIPTDPDWYRIQADYWEDRGDPFAEPCRRFGEYLSEMFMPRPEQNPRAAP